MSLSFLCVAWERQVSAYDKRVINDCHTDYYKYNYYKYNNYVYNKSDLPPLFNKHCFSACNNFLLKAGSF